MIGVLLFQLEHAFIRRRLIQLLIDTKSNNSILIVVTGQLYTVFVTNTIQLSHKKLLRYRVNKSKKNLVENFHFALV